MQKIITKSGQEYEVEYVDASTMSAPPSLFIQVVGMTLLEAVTLFSDKEETAEITYMNDEQVVAVYENYTNLAAANVIQRTNIVNMTLLYEQPAEEENEPEE